MPFLTNAVVTLYADPVPIASCRHVNVSHDELRELLAAAVGGLHTMQDEHFGISIVEYMAAGAPAIFPSD